MGEGPVRVVLDTNVLVSALLFKRELARLVDLWKEGKIILLFSKETFGEFLRVLAYPKFKLNDDEIRAIVEMEVLPYSETVGEVEGSFGCRDPEDEKFLRCASSGRAEFLVTGDEDLLSMEGTLRRTSIVKPSHFLKFMERRGKELWSNQERKGS